MKNNMDFYKAQKGLVLSGSIPKSPKP